MAKHGGFAGGMPGMNMNNLMKQYQKMQKKLEETQEELAKKEYTGQAGGGAVKIVISGEKKVLKVSLNKDAVDPEDVETLEEMIALAVNQALTEIEKDSSQEMGRLTGGRSFPDFPVSVRSRHSAWLITSLMKRRKVPTLFPTV